MPAWDADIAVDASLVRSVLAEQFPELDAAFGAAARPEPSRGHAVLRRAPVDDERLLRARATALYFCAMLAAYAHDNGRERLLRESVAGLERTLL